MPILLLLNLFSLQAIKKKKNIYLSGFDWLLSKGFCSNKAWFDMIKYTEFNFKVNFWQFKCLLPNRNVNKSPYLEKVLEIHQSSQQISTFTLYIFNRSARVSYYVIFLSLVTQRKKVKTEET